MFNMDGLGAVEIGAIEGLSTKVSECLENFNKSFTSKLSPENGIYGEVKEVIDSGVNKLIGKNELGHTFIEYKSAEGLITKVRENLGNGNIKVTSFDDKGTAYLQEVTTICDREIKNVSSKLTPNITVIKGNFSSVIDAYGRPIINKINDLSLKEGTRESLNGIDKIEGYEKGHIIADSFGGPASQENVVAQLTNVNRSKFATIENEIRKLKNEGHTVDYEVKVNYTDSKSEIPSSFEPQITVDGKKYELPEKYADLKKIYNETDDQLTGAKKFKINVEEKFGVANELGIKSGLVAAGLTMVVSSVENISSYVGGEISAEQMVVDIAKDTAIAGATGYGTTFISTAVSQAMAKSSVALIRNVGNSCLPAAVVAFGVESYDDIAAFAKGDIDGTELAYNLGENAASVAGGFALGAVAGAGLGYVCGPVGSVAGSIIGGVVGCVLATEAYETAIEYGAEGAEYLADKAQALANNVIDNVATSAPEALDNVKETFSSFANSVKLPLSFA